jgi:hypothetical protein
MALPCSIPKNDTHELTIHDYYDTHIRRTTTATTLDIATTRHTLACHDGRIAAHALTIALPWLYASMGLPRTIARTRPPETMGRLKSPCLARLVVRPSGDVEKSADTRRH